MLRRLLIIVAIALAFPVGAIAAPDPPEGWGAAELRIAQEYWGISRPPLCSTLSAEFDAALPSWEEGEGTQPTKPNTPCTMRIADDGTGIYFQCLTVIHEFGHWLGLPHSSDPSSVMAAQFNRSIHVQSCKRLANKRAYP